MAAVGKTETFRERVKLKLGAIDAPKLAPSNDVVDVCIDAGLNQYSRIKSRIVVKEIAGDGTTKRYVLDSALDVWIPGFSILTKVAMVQDKNTDNELETEFTTSQREMRKDSSANDVLFLTETVATGKDLRLEHTTTHLIDDASAANTTVPDVDTDLLTALTASYVAAWIARKASDLANVQLGASEIDYGRMRSHWSDRAKELAREASEYIDPRVIAHESAGVTREWTSESRLAPRRISH